MVTGLSGGINAVKNFAGRIVQSALGRVAPVVLKDSQLNVYNFRAMSEQPASRFGAIRFDPNNTCNLHCVYCHNHRDDQTIALDAFEAFLNRNVIGVNYFQVGCIMEPTLDPCIADFMLAVSRSRAKPEHNLVLQTNGILLHKHDTAKMRDAGLNLLSVSVDAAEPGTQKELRSGTSLDKVTRNVADFRAKMPEATIDFITTVTTANVTKMVPLVRLGLDLGVNRFLFREVFYHPENNVVDHTRMPGLLLRPGQFEEMKQEVLSHFGSQAKFIFAAEEVLDASVKKMKTDSLRQ
jgi:MoaA/NifB/PqqE/SkfB family radical SAM enzyme